MGAFKDVVLLSGGIDSEVCAEWSRLAGTLVGCVFTDYGHPAQRMEGWKAGAYCHARGVLLMKIPHVRDINLGDMASEAGARVVPHRNALLLVLAANIAHGMGATRLIFGANADDQADYVDCRAPFITGMAAVLGMSVAAPLLGMRKSGVIAEARRLGLTRDDAWSCYGPGPVACGECPSCVEADRAWTNTG